MMRLRLDVAAQRRVAQVVADWWWPVASLAIVGAWVAVAVSGSERVPPLAAATAAGTAAVAAVPGLPRAAVPDLTALAAVLIVPITVAEAVRGGNVLPLGIALCAVVLLAGFGRGPTARTPVGLFALGLGVAAAVTGVVEGSADFAKLRLAVPHRPAAALVVAGAGLVISAIDDRTHAERAVAVPIVLAALLATPALPPLATVIWWGGFAVVAATLERPGVATAALAIVAAAAGAPAPALLLGAGAVLAWTIDGPPAALCALPGAVALANLLAGRSVTAVSAVAAAALAVTGVAALLRFRPAIRVGGGTPIGLALAAWLVVAPGSWRFTGVNSLGAYDAGAARAVAVAALAVVVVVLRTGAEWDWPRARVPTESALVIPPAPAAMLRVVGMAATVAAAAWLVVSVIRLH